MDENKETLAPETEAENTANSDTDTVTEENTTENIDFSAFEEELAETADEPEQTEQADESIENVTPAKKKSLIQLPIIISVIIVAVVALGFLVFKCFFDTSIVGTWSIESTASADEAGEPDYSYKTYYTFESNGTAKVNVGTIEYVGTYTLSTDDDGTRSVAINLTSSDTYSYEVTGNIFTGRTLVFTDTYYGYSYTLNGDSLDLPKLSADDSFTPNDSVTGDWNYYDGYYDYTYSFNDDGTVLINQLDMIYVKGTYTYTDDTITVTYYGSEETTMDIAYTVIDSDEIILNGLQCFRVGSASADEAASNLSLYY